MSERIKELAKAYLVHERYTRYGEIVEEDLYEFYPDELEEFAELIVRECADLCLKHAEYEGPFNTMEYRKGQHFNTIIKNHFGVK